MKTGKQLIFFILAGILFSAFLLSGKNNTSDTASPSAPLVFNYKWYSPPIPESMNFAGEKVPLEQWNIKEQFDKQLTANYYWQGEILYILKLSQRYFPIIEERLRTNGVPDDMKFLCVAESKLQNQVSRAGAAGFWQFMPGTAPSYGLEVNSDVDERYDIIKSTDAACKYLKEAYEKLGNWTAAAASYNCGQGGYNNNADFQRTTNYYDLLLPEETNQYIFRILTFKYLLSSAKMLGYILTPKDVYQNPEIKKVVVEDSIPDLVAFAIENGTTYKMLKVLNPWLRGRKLSVKPGKSYTVSFPAS